MGGAKGAAKAKTVLSLRVSDVRGKRGMEESCGWCKRCAKSKDSALTESPGREGQEGHGGELWVVQKVRQKQREVHSLGVPDVRGKRGMEESCGWCKRCAKSKGKCTH